MRFHVHVSCEFIKKKYQLQYLLFYECFNYDFWLLIRIKYLLEWLKFLHVKRNQYICDPEVTCHVGGCWDTARLCNSENTLSNETGQHAFCDVDGNSLKLSDITDGMHVKIRAKNVEFPGYEYLYTAEGIRGKYFVICTIKP